MRKITSSLKKNITAVKQVLSDSDVLAFSFLTKGGTPCGVLYIDELTDKFTLGEAVIRPLTAYDGKAEIDGVRSCLLSPEIKEANDFNAVVSAILDGEAVLFVEGCDVPTVIGVKKIPMRAISEPPTDVAVKGPRAGFIEDIKTNLAMVRMRIKTTDLKTEVIEVGKQSKTKIAIVYINSIADKKNVEKIKEKINGIEIDHIPDSSYITKIISQKPFSIFKHAGTTEKPDKLCSEILEGKIGIIADGSPIALTVPYVAMQDFQASEDYFINPYRATITRIIRYFSVFVAIYLPAVYMSAQLFKIQLIPSSLILTIASGAQGIPLSPSLEMALVLFMLEVLNEASIRMPKYVGYALSIVGALVLGDTVVSAGIVSTTAIIIVAMSGICLYTVPNLYETTSVLRWIMLFIAGSIGTYGIVLFTAFLLYYMITDDNYSTPLLAPFSPFILNDLKDSFVRFRLFAMKLRPRVFKAENKRRFKDNGKD